VSYTGPGWTAPCCSPCTPLTTAPAQLQQSREAAKSRDLRTPVKTTGAAPPEAAPPPAGTAASPVGGTFEKIGKVLDASLSIFGLLGRGVRAGGAAAPHDVVDSPGAVPHGGVPPAPPPPSRTKWTRRVPHPVLIGHAASVAPY
jgi:hypothetical protein